MVRVCPEHRVGREWDGAQMRCPAHRLAVLRRARARYNASPRGRASAMAYEAFTRPIIRAGGAERAARLQLAELGVSV